MTACVLKYLVKGVNVDRDNQGDLQRELQDALPNAQSIVILPVVQGFSVEIEINDLHPFNRVSIEPYVAEHVIPEAVSIGCRSEGHEIQLLKTHFR